MKPKKIFMIFMIVLISLLFIAGCQKKVSYNENENEKDAFPPGDSGTENVKPDEEFNFVFIKKPERVEHRTYSIVKQGDWGETEYNNSFIYIPPEGNLSDPFSEKFAVTVVFMAEDEKRTIKELTELDIEKTGELLPHLNVMEQNEDASLGSLDAIRVVFTVEYEGKPLQSTQIRAMQGNRFYVFSQQCEYGKCKYNNLFTEMAMTFQWKNP